MAWREEHRLASFRSLAGAGTWSRFPAFADDKSAAGSAARSRLLGAILWLQLGVRLGYWGRRQAQAVVEELSPAFTDIYDWLRAHGRSLPSGLVDELLRIKDEGLSGDSLSRFPSAEVAHLHFRHALIVVGSYLPLRQGLWSPLAGVITYAPDDVWNSAVGSVSAMIGDSPEAVVPFVDDVPGLLRSMDSALTVANAVGRDGRLDLLQQQQLSNELLATLAWPLYLGTAGPQRRFREFFSALFERLSRDLEAESVVAAAQKDVTRLTEAWENIELGSAQLAVRS